MQRTEGEIGFPNTHTAFNKRNYVYKLYCFVRTSPLLLFTLTNVEVSVDFIAVILFHRLHKNKTRNMNNENNFQNELREILKTF